MSFEQVYAHTHTEEVIPAEVNEHQLEEQKAISLLKQAAGWTPGLTKGSFQLELAPTEDGGYLATARRLGGVIPVSPPVLLNALGKAFESARVASATSLTQTAGGVRIRRGAVLAFAAAVRRDMGHRYTGICTLINNDPHLSEDARDRERRNLQIDPTSSESFQAFGESLRSNCGFTMRVRETFSQNSGWARGADKK